MNRIIVDWGTSSFRAYRFSPGGSVAETRRADAGIMTVEGARFEEVLRREIGDWLSAPAEVFLSGMITSRNGWVETPYIETPASLGDLASGTVRREIAGGIALRFLPGVCQRWPSPDVMRGEEIQIFGAFGEGRSGTALHPGTHSKWVRVEDGRIAGFRSFMSGELFAVMRQHSILGRLIPEGVAAFDETAFLAGVRQAAADGSPGLLGDLFSARSGVLLEAFGAQEVAERLSGLIIGHEIKGAVALGWTGSEVLLFGETGLIRRYGAALSHFGIAYTPGPDDATIAGFRRLGALK